MAGQGFKTRSRNYNTFFSLPVASFLLSLILAPAAFCEADLYKHSLFQDEHNKNSRLAVMPKAHQLRKRRELQSFADKITG